jgi:hypothetical protein
MKKIIIQCGPARTGSTVLVNALYGLMHSGRPVYYRSHTIYEHDYIIKAHRPDLDHWVNRYKDVYEIYFVCSVRKEKGFDIDEKFKSWPNVILFDYDELLETEENTLEDIMDNLITKLDPFFKYEINMNKQNGITRIQEMNRRYEEIKNKSFLYLDEFYHLHGHHRNRDDTTSVTTEEKVVENKK